MAVNFRTNKNGIKVYYIDYYDSGGRRIRERVGTSKSLAEIVLKKRKVQIAEGRFLDIKRKPKITLKGIIELYLKEYAEPNNRSYATKISRAKNILSYFGHEELATEITPLDLEKYKSYRKEKVSLATVNRELSLIKHVFSKGIEWGKLYDNPAKKVRMFKEENRRLRFLSEEDIIRLVDCAQDKLKSIIITAVSTGMRKSEILNLKWKDVDFDTGFITVLNSKGGDKREIPISNILEENLRNVIRYIGSEYVFNNEHGKPIKSFKRSFKATLKLAGITDFRFHDLRHTFASHLVMRGTDIKTVQELLGHKSLDMTLRYSHLSPNHKRRAIQNIDTIWTQGKKEGFEGIRK